MSSFIQIRRSFNNVHYFLIVSDVHSNWVIFINNLMIMCAYDETKQTTSFGICVGFFFIVMNPSTFNWLIFLSVNFSSVLLNNKFFWSPFGLGVCCVLWEQYNEVFVSLIWHHKSFRKTYNFFINLRVNTKLHCNRLFKTYIIRYKII